MSVHPAAQKLHHCLVSSFRGTISLGMKSCRHLEFDVTLKVIIGKRERASPPDSEVVSPLAREGWRLNFNNGAINLVEIFEYRSVDGAMSTLRPGITGATQFIVPLGRPWGLLPGAVPKFRIPVLPPKLPPTVDTGCSFALTVLLRPWNRQ